MEKKGEKKSVDWERGQGGGYTLGSLSSLSSLSLPNSVYALLANFFFALFPHHGACSQAMGSGDCEING